MLLKFLIGLSGGLLIFGIVLWLIYLERRKNRFSPFTENMLRSPGYTLNQKLQDLSDDLVTPLITLGGMPFLYGFLFLDTKFVAQITIIPLILGFMGHSFFKIKRIFSESQKVKLGMYGEIYTGQELNYLMQKGAWVYHDIPYKYGNIDHLVISKAGVFAIETKAVRKPVNNNGGRDAKVIVTKNQIKFPHLATAEPIEQVDRHATYLTKTLSEKLGVKCPVFKVISLPGWYVKDEDKNLKKGFLVINPKRGLALERFINEKERIKEQDLTRLITIIEELARSVEARSNITDPDARKKYSFLLDRKYDENKF